ncbi:MAG TPA: ParB N-terminal domain-containing protein [Burkholderiaceae bacterium]|nr:ParB N-terminal domain-containing protein [Burkholderiaceae bacterium]
MARKAAALVAPVVGAELAGYAVEAVPVDSLQLDPDNARTHNPRSIATLKGLLQRFGQQKPVVAEPGTRIVRAGNGTLLAARELGWPTIAVHWTALAGDEARAFALADNRAGELSFFDEATLARQLTSFDDHELAAIIGFDAGDLQGLAGLAIDDLAGDGEPGEVGARKSQPRVPRSSDVTVRVLVGRGRAAAALRGLLLRQRTLHDALPRALRAPEMKQPPGCETGG